MGRKIKTAKAEGKMVPLGCMVPEDFRWRVREVSSRRKQSITDFIVEALREKIEREAA